MNGNYNVSYEDIDALAYPVLRHRIKINFNAINDKLGVDDVIKLLVDECRRGAGRLRTQTADTEEQTEDKKKKKDKRNPEEI